MIVDGGRGGCRSCGGRGGGGGGPESDNGVIREGGGGHEGPKKRDMIFERSHRDNFVLYMSVYVKKCDNRFIGLSVMHKLRLWGGGAQCQKMGLCVLLESKKKEVQLTMNLSQL